MASSCPECGSENFIETWFTEECKDCGYSYMYPDVGNVRHDISDDNRSDIKADD